MKDTEAIARKAFAEIASQFPSLQIVEDKDLPVEISIQIPIQPGLNQKVWLCLQNGDELHFAVSNFWLEWFPCTKPERVKSFVDAVVGFLSGKYRIIEHFRGTKCFKAELQMPESDGWQTIGTRWKFSLPFPFKKTLQEVRNI
jgi:hypothetical protein